MSALDDIIQGARTLVREPYPALAERAAREGRRAWGYTCLFAPDELLEAAGLWPVRLFGAGTGMHRVERHLTSNCCEFARSLLEGFLEDRFAFLEGVVVPHSCDPLQVVFDIARRERPATAFYFFNMPTSLAPQRARDLVLIELERLKAFLEHKVGRALTPAVLEAACEGAERHDRVLGALYDLRRTKPGLLSGSDAAALTLAGLFLPRDEHTDLLERALRELRDKPYSPPRKLKRRVVLSGFANGSLALLELLERSGAIVVDDDLCEGSRRLGSRTVTSGPPLDRIAARVVDRYCPVKVQGPRGQFDILRERYRAAQADGAILAHFPFCDPQLLEHATMRGRFAAESMNVLPVEIVIGDRNLGQLETRIEAFLERLRPRSAG